jgi:hypothetical protein
MILKLIKIGVLFLITLSLHATETENQYAVGNIPKSLLVNANAVVRNDEMLYTIEDIGHSSVKIKHAITLLNDKASDYRYYRIPYNQFIKISGIKAYVYDSNGDLVLNAHPDITDVSNSYEDLANDNRYWLISFPVRKYPYTLEIEYEKSNEGSFFYDDWGFRSQPDVSVQQSGAQFVVKKGLGFRVYEENLKFKCDTFSMDKNMIYTWQEENIPAVKNEELYSISFTDQAPYILTAPNQFVMGGFKGDMETWEKFGDWFYKLNKDRDVISTELQSKLKQLIQNTANKEEIVKIIYQYLQKNTRYVSIQLGIGGYQSLEASFVEKKGYGDCKALTNYMKAMLKSVGIPSYQALISTDKDVINTFPSNQFNHVILCVPVEADTIWLECTNQEYPFNFLGSLSDKNVLLLTENGGKLIKTPQYTLEANQINTKIAVNVDFFGNAEVNANMRFVGLAYQRSIYKLSNSKKDREAYINSLFSNPNLEIKKSEYQKIFAKYPEVNLNCNLDIRDFGIRTKKRIIFNSNVFEPVQYLPVFEEKDFKVLPFPLMTDTIEFALPFGYKIEFVPESSNIESKFGKYNKLYQLKNDKLVVIRKIELYEKKYNKEEISSFSDFINKMATKDKELILLIKE